MNQDPRHAHTLDEAAQNPDGTYNGAAALSWLSEVPHPGKGVPAKDVMEIFEAEKAKRLRNLNDGKAE